MHFDDDLQLKGCAFVVAEKMKSKKIGKHSRVWLMVIFVLLTVCVFFLSPAWLRNNEVWVYR